MLDVLERSASQSFWQFAHVRLLFEMSNVPERLTFGVCELCIRFLEFGAKQQVISGNRIWIRQLVGECICMRIKKAIEWMDEGSFHM